MQVKGDLKLNGIIEEILKKEFTSRIYNVFSVHTRAKQINRIKSAHGYITMRLLI